MGAPKCLAVATRGQCSEFGQVYSEQLEETPTGQCQHCTLQIHELQRVLSQLNGFEHRQVYSSFFSLLSTLKHCLVAPAEACSTQRHCSQLGHVYSSLSSSSPTAQHQRGVPEAVRCLLLHTPNRNRFQTGQISHLTYQTVLE